MRENRHGKGYTLLEMIITIAIMSILLSIAVPSLNNVRNEMIVDYGIRQLQRDLRFAQQKAQQNHSKVLITFFTDTSPCRYVVREYGKAVYFREGYLPANLTAYQVSSITILPDRTIQKNGHILLEKHQMQRYLYYYQTGRCRITAKASRT